MKISACSKALLWACVLLTTTACNGQAGAPGQSPTSATAPAASSTARPAVLAKIESQGLEIMGDFDAPSGLHGYAGLAGQEPLTVYTTADGKHALVGVLVDAKGNDVGADALRRLVTLPLSKRQWAALQSSTWIADGAANAPRVVYAFTDPNCPYCHRFWEAARPWIESGKVQLRHVMVGVIRPDSANKVATMLTAKSPSDALVRNERTFDKGGIEAAAQVPEAVRQKLDGNEKLMLQMGFQGTPGIVYLDANGVLQRRSGLPSSDQLPVILGPR
jgi:thiol:disulfide interchange protein DsbG